MWSAETTPKTAVVKTNQVGVGFSGCVVCVMMGSATHEAPIVPVQPAHKNVGTALPPETPVVKTFFVNALISLMRTGEKWPNPRSRGSGNPSGKPRGCRNKATREVEALLAGEGPDASFRPRRPEDGDGGRIIFEVGDRQ